MSSFPGIEGSLYLEHICLVRAKKSLGLGLGMSSNSNAISEQTFSNLKSLECFRKEASCLLYSNTKKWSLRANINFCRPWSRRPGPVNWVLF